MKTRRKLLVIIAATLLVGIGVFSFYKMNDVKAETDEYVPISHSDEIFFELP